MLRKTANAVGVLVALYHGWLLPSQAWSGELFEPERLLRWLAAAALAAVVIGLQRRGVSALFGRRAVAVWLLAALLHAPAVAERLSGTDTSALPRAVAVLEQCALAALVVGLGLYAAGAPPPRDELSVARFIVVGAFVAARHLSVSTSLNFAPRPPPSA